jgi:LysM repeat protein
VKSDFIAGYKAAAPYKGLLFNCNGQNYLASEGWSTLVDSASVSSYPKSSTSFGPAICSQLLLTSTSKVGRFLYVSDTNQYYLVDAGKKRLISSKSAYDKLSVGLTPAYEVRSWLANRFFTGTAAPVKVPSGSSGGSGTGGTNTGGSSAGGTNTGGTGGSTQVKYTVKSGDTLGGIASRYKISLASLMAANSITNANSIQVGQVLIIPKS